MLQFYWLWCCAHMIILTYYYGNRRDLYLPHRFHIYSVKLYDKTKISDEYLKQNN